MKDVHPLFNSATHYRIEVRGRVDVEWLKSFDHSAGITFDENRQMGETTMLNVHTDQSGIVGLVRTLHGLGMTILLVQIVPEEAKMAEIKDHL